MCWLGPPNSQVKAALPLCRWHGLELKVVMAFAIGSIFVVTHCLGRWCWVIRGSLEWHFGRARYLPILVDWWLARRFSRLQDLLAWLSQCVSMLTSWPFTCTYVSVCVCGCDNTWQQGIGDTSQVPCLVFQEKNWGSLLECIIAWNMLTFNL